MNRTKRLLTLLLLACGMTAGAWAQTAILIRNAQPVGVYCGAASLSNAINAAEASGDVILLSSGNYNNPGNITKSVSIYGQGHEGASTRTYIKGKLEFKSTGEGSLDNIHLEGLYLENHFNLLNDNSRNPINKLTVVKCHITGMFIYMNSAGVTLRNCVLQGDFKCYPDDYVATNMLFENCWKDGGSLNHFAEGSDITIRNSIFHARSLSGFDNSNAFTKVTYENSVISDCILAANSTATNCVLLNVNTSANGITTTNCWTETSASNVFANATSCIYSEGTCPTVNSTYVGNDNTLTGITGGNYPWSVVPDEPNVDLSTTLLQDVDGYYLLGTAADWAEFKRVVETINPMANARMTADIDLGDDQTILGATEALAYKGTFDGQGHTLTVNLNSTAEIWAPFRFVGDGAVIRNLHIAGTVNGAHRRIGGLVGEGKGKYSISNCISSVTINTTYSGDGIQGGFVASQRGTLQISDCIFDGVFHGPKAYTWGGIVGWNYGTTSISNCLVLCDSYSVSMSDVATFIPNDNNITNCFYKTAIGTAQGTQTTAGELANGTTAYKLQNNRTGLVWGQRMNSDAEPVLTSDESCRVYRSINGGYTNNPELAYSGSLEQDAEGYYLLRSLFDWQDFAMLVDATPTANARLMADINLGDDQTKIASSDNVYYQGIFDGQGYSLTMAYAVADGSSQHVAPFIKIKNATIKNLYVKGSITTAGVRPAGITSYVSGACGISNCWSEVAITSDYGADICAGGLVSRIDANQTLNMSDCGFTGSITLSNINGYRAGGLIGWTQDNGIANVQNCLFAPSGVTSTKSSTDNKLLVSGNLSKVSFSSCYYKHVGSTTNWTTQGTSATDEDLADGTISYKLQHNRDDLVWGQRIGTDANPLLASDGNYRVYRSKNGGYTNNPELAYSGSLEQDAEGYYLLRNLFDWQDFAMLVDATPTANARMVADIDLGNDQTMIASGGNIYYKGTFDGQGHALTVAYEETDASSEHVAPFIKIQGATIKNLHVKGSINTAGKKPAGIASHINGTSYIRNCWSEVDITSSYNGEIGAGGLVAWVDHYAWIYMDDCLFSGSITLSNSVGYKAGGLIGWKEGYSNARLTNCLSAPENMSSIKSSSDNSMLISGSNFTEGQKIITTNCYYVNVGSSTTWSVQGKEAQSSQRADGSLAYKLQAFRDELIWGQKLGTDAVPLPYTVDENRRVYRANDGGFTNTPADGYVFHQDTDGYYPVGSVHDWQDFSILVETIPTVNAKMTEDVDLGDDQTVIATTYSGTFDGQGYTLTVNLTATQRNYGLFCVLAGATIKNLHVTGMVTTSYRCTGGIVGLSYSGTNTLTNCRSSVTMKVTNNADHTGGLIGSTEYHITINIRDCLFDGSFDGAQSSTWGGIIGQNYYSYINISNSLFAPTSINIKDGLYTFSYNYGGATLTNCFTSVSGNTTQGVSVTAEQISNGSVAYLLQKGRNDLIWGQVLETDTHPVLFGDNNSRVYSTANGDFTNDPSQAGSDLVLDFTIADNGDITIKGFRSEFNPPTDYALVIPDYIGGYPVVAIARDAFKEKATIKSLSLGRHVQSIGYNAFKQCTGLQSVVIPNNVTSLDDAVFSGCTSLSSATFEDGCQLTKIPYDAFYNCTSLTGITIPSSVTFIDGYAFQNCNMTSLTIPANVTSLGGSICSGNSNLATFDLSKATQIAALYGMTTVDRNSGIFAGIPATCDVILPYGCQAAGDHVTIAEPDENSIGIADDGYYELNKPEHWKVFSAIAQGKPTANARLTADIDLGDDQTMIASGDNVYYQGTFDGQGHSLTMAYAVTDGSSQHVAPFIKIKNATIQNLHVKGSITTAGVRPAGITSYVTGTSYIRNCWSEVAIVSSQNGWVDGSGFVGRIDSNNTLNMDDCVFTGSITLSNSNGYEMGGFVGWTQSNGIANIQNCLFAPSGITSTKVSTDNKMLVNGYQDKVTITNCYYRHVGSTTNWTAQGTSATDDELADGTITDLLQNGRDGEIWVQNYVTWQPRLAIFDSGTEAKLPYAIWCDESKTLYFDYTNAGLRVGKTYDDQTITAIWYGNSVVKTQYEEVPAWSSVVKETCAHVVFKESFSEMRPTSLHYWFAHFTLLEDIMGLEYLNTSEATTMRGMFLFCDALQTIDVSNFNTSKSTSFRSMFDHCVSVKTLDVSSFDMKEGDNTQNMFYNCQELQVIYSYNEWYSKIGSGDNTYTMFYNCSKLVGGTGYKFDQTSEYKDGRFATFDYLFTPKPTYAYTVPSSGIGTFSIGYEMEKPQGLKAYYCKNYDSAEGTISVVAIKGTVPANTGVLLKGEPGETYTLTISNETAESVSDNALVAVTVQTHIDQRATIDEVEYTNFGLSGGVFKKVNSNGGTVRANRAYLHIPSSALTSAALARGISMVWDENEATSISETRNGDEEVRNAHWYTLDGRKLNGRPNDKGLYIVNGQKVIIK